jgi:hypothetical protein
MHVTPQDGMFHPESVSIFYLLQHSYISSASKLLCYTKICYIFVSHLI